MYAAAILRIVTGQLAKQPFGLCASTRDTTPPAPLNVAAFWAKVRIMGGGVTLGGGSGFGPREGVLWGLIYDPYQTCMSTFVHKTHFYDMVCNNPSKFRGFGT